MGRCARRPKRRPVRGGLKRPRRSIYQAVRGLGAVEAAWE